MCANVKISVNRVRVRMSVSVRKSLRMGIVKGEDEGADGYDCASMPVVVVCTVGSLSLRQNNGCRYLASSL